MRWLLSLLPLIGLPIAVSEAIAGEAIQTELDIPFLTTRGFEILADGGVSYFTDVAELSAGQCQVTLVNGDETEALNGEITQRPLDEVMDLFGTTSSTDMLVYVHGYNISLERACRDAARLARATEFEDRLLLLSWPASRALVTYNKDEQRLAESTPALVSALHELGRRHGYETINIVAHSMGSRLLLALDQDIPQPDPQSKSQFARLVLVASDIDKERFRAGAQQLMKHVKEISVLVSDDDRLLLLSQLVNFGERLGQASDLDVDGVDIIDVSEFEDLGFTRHIYHLENDRVGNLIRQLLSTSPAD